MTYGCDRCEHTGWVLTRVDGQPTVHVCPCSPYWTGRFNSVQCQSCNGTGFVRYPSVTDEP